MNEQNQTENDREPFYVSAGVADALSEAARAGRDINIAGALYRKTNHGQPSTPPARPLTRRRPAMAENQAESDAMRCEASTPPGHPHHPCTQSFGHDGPHRADATEPGIPSAATDGGA